jgi:hypothetical protein
MEEMEIAYEEARKYLPNAIYSMSCRREFTQKPKRGKWITVYPDINLTFKRRGVEDYERERKHERMGVGEL